MQGLGSASDETWDAIVIGAGNAALTCAATLARAGKRTLLLERHNVPGGCATSFMRGRFEFEVALHQLSGLGTEESPGVLRALFDELGVTKNLEFVHERDLYRVFVPGEIDCTLPADREGFTKVLESEFPHERLAIGRFVDLLHRTAPQFFAGKDLLQTRYTLDEAREKYPEYFRYGLSTAKDVLDEFFEDEKLKHLLAAYWGYLGSPPSEMKFTGLALLFWAYQLWKPSHVVGGSQAISNAILDAFHEAGGRSRFSCGVRRILVEEGRATGVETDAGERISAEVVVSNVSPIVTYSQMMDPAGVPEWVHRDMASRKIGVSGFVVYAGLDCDPGDLGIETSLTFIGRDIDHDLAVRQMRSFEPPGYLLFSCFDHANPDFSPKGASQVGLVTLQYADHWLGLEPEEYADAKYAYAEHLMEMAEGCYPGFRSRIEEVEVSTPLTHMRYLGHPGGAIYGFEQDVMDSDILRQPQVDPPIANLHLAGSWVATGGFQPTLQAGADLARHLISDLSEETQR